MILYIEKRHIRNFGSSEWGPMTHSDSFFISYLETPFANVNRLITSLPDMLDIRVMGLF